METKSIKIILIVIAIGIWMLVIQNFGLLGKEGTQPVRVVNTVGVRGQVDVNGTVDVGNTVDINISEINGKSNVFYDHGYDGNYNRIPVYTGN